MATLLIRNIHTLITMNSYRHQIQNGSIIVRDNTIEWDGTSSALPIDRVKADRIINA